MLNIKIMDNDIKDHAVNASWFVQGWLRELEIESFYYITGTDGEAEREFTDKFWIARDLYKVLFAT